MKKFFAGALFLSICSVTWGQISITRNDMPSIGNTARFSLTDNSINVNNTGPNMVWDYSHLVITGQDIDSFRSLLAINPLYYLSFGVTDYGIRTDNFPTVAALSINNAYSFYKKTNSYLSVDGFGAEFNGIPIPAVYSTEDKVYQFPLTYGRRDTTPYELTVTIPSFGSLRQSGMRYTSVDGWGTVITPYGTFQCLRVRAYTEETDYVTIDALGTSIPIPRNTLTYQWLAKGQIIPVLEVSGTVQFNTFIVNRRRFRDNVRVVPPQFSINADFIANTTYCNTDAIVQLTNTTRPNVSGSKYKYIITPSTYSFVAGTNDSMASPKVNFNAPGLYSVSLHVESPAGGGVPAISDEVKTDYINVIFPLGINDAANGEDIKLYPNPVSEILNVHHSEIITAVTMINRLGQKVMTRSVDANSVAISVKAYEEGTYLLDIETKSGHQIRKVVIQ